MNYFLKAITFAFFFALFATLILMTGAPGAPIYFFRYWIAFFVAYVLFDALKHVLRRTL
jgi:hypothetical protein